MVKEERAKIEDDNEDMYFEGESEEDTFDSDSMEELGGDPFDEDEDFFSGSDTEDEDFFSGSDTEDEDFFSGSDTEDEDFFSGSDTEDTFGNDGDGFEDGFGNEEEDIINEEEMERESVVSRDGSMGNSGEYSINEKVSSVGEESVNSTVADEKEEKKIDWREGDGNDFITNKGAQVRVMDGKEGVYRIEYIDIEKVLVSKRIRSNLVVGSIKQSISNTGLLTPIEVAPLAAEGMYVLLDGERRLEACKSLRYTQIPCIVNNKIITSEIAIVGAIANHREPYTNHDIIEFIEHMEKVNGIFSPLTIEYILDLNSGDYLKIKDVFGYEEAEIIEKMDSGEYSFQEAFKKVEKSRKEAGKEAAKIKSAESASADNDLEANSGERFTQGELEEELEEMNNENIEDMKLEDLIDKGEVDGYQPNVQDKKNRTRLDPTLRKSVLARDENTCQVCKIISGMEYTEVLDVHHKIEVYLGGSDAIENLMTACTVCHKLIHLWGRGELSIRDMDKLTEVEREKFKRVVFYGNKIRKLSKGKIGIEKLKEVDNMDTIGRTLKGSSEQVAG